VTVSRFRHVSVAVPLACLGVALAGCSSSTTYGTGERPETAILRELTGGYGLTGKKEKEPIAYQPRSPLVMPPAATLRPPVETAEARAGAAWPSDPDRAGPIPDDTFAGLSPAEQRAKVKELRGLAGMTGTTGRQAPTVGPSNEEQRGNFYAWLRDHKKERDDFKAAYDEQSGAGAKRRYLTEPPDEYRQPAATAPASPPEAKPKRSFFSRLFRRGN